MGDRLRGKCVEMCPPSQINDHRKPVSPFEKDPKTGEFDPKRAIKAFPRSAAGVERSESDVRTTQTLQKTVQYIIEVVIGQQTTQYPGPTDELNMYNYVRDKLRAVVQDIALQSANGPEVIDILEKITLFYVFAGAKLIKNPEFDVISNRKQISSTLTALNDAYQHYFYRYHERHPSEPIFRAIQLMIVDTDRPFSVLMLTIPKGMLTHPWIRRVTMLHRCLISFSIEEFEALLRTTPIQLVAAYLCSPPDFLHLDYKQQKEKQKQPLESLFSAVPFTRAFILGELEEKTRVHVEPSYTASDMYIPPPIEEIKAPVELISLPPVKQPETRRDTKPAQDAKVKQETSRAVIDEDLQESLREEHKEEEDVPSVIVMQSRVYTNREHVYSPIDLTHLLSRDVPPLAYSNVLLKASEQTISSEFARRRLNRRIPQFIPVKNERTQLYVSIIPEEAAESLLFPTSVLLCDDLDVSTELPLHVFQYEGQRDVLSFDSKLMQAIEEGLVELRCYDLADILRDILSQTLHRTKGALSYSYAMERIQDVLDVFCQAVVSRDFMLLMPPQVFDFPSTQEIEVYLSGLYSLFRSFGDSLAQMQNEGDTSMIYYITSENGLMGAIQSFVVVLKSDFDPEKMVESIVNVLADNDVSFVQPSYSTQGAAELLQLFDKDLYQ